MGDVLCSNSLVKNEIKPKNITKKNIEKSGLGKSESPESSVSPKALAFMNKIEKVKCPTCDYKSEPFFMKIHQCPNVQQELDCEVCKKNHKKRFRTSDKGNYKNHMLTKHRKCLK